MIFFDRGGSVRGACHALGGAFVEPGTGGANGVAPLAHVAELGADWTLGWLTELVRRGLGIVSVDQAQELRRAAQDMARPGAKVRTLDDVLNYVQDRDLRIALKAWTEGPRAGMFDHDGLDVDAALSRGGDKAVLTVFETGELMAAREDVQVLTLDYIFAQVERRFDGRPTLVVLDEAWSFFEHELFRERVKDWLKTGRKKNVAVVMATQSIADATNAKITAHLFESCPTRIFLPNPEARGHLIARDYAALGLSPTQIELIARIEAKRDYYILQPERRRVVQFPLGPGALALLARTGKDDSDRIAALANRNPDDLGEIALRFATLGLCYAVLQWPGETIDLVVGQTRQMAGGAAGSGTSFALGDYMAGKMALILSLFEGVMIREIGAQLVLAVFSLTILGAVALQIGFIVYWYANLFFTGAAALILMGFGGLTRTVPITRTYLLHLLGAALSLLTVYMVLAFVQDLAWDTRIEVNALGASFIVALLEVFALVLLWVLPASVGRLAKG